MANVKEMSEEEYQKLFWTDQSAVTLLTYLLEKGYIKVEGRKLGTKKWGSKN